MFKRNEIVYSPTDLTTFMVSPFASWMNRLRMEHPDLVPQADPADDLSGLLAKKGLDLEKKLLKEFEEQGKTIADLSGDGESSEQKVEQRLLKTLSAMESGVDIIFQGVLEAFSFRGFADFLIKVPGSSRFGDYLYEVIDTKLASRARPEFVTQLCCYSDILESVQGSRPKTITLALGRGDIEKLKTDDYFFYYLALKERFLHEQSNFNPKEMPDPYDSRSFGAWGTYAEKILQERDHLSQIANITRSNVKKLNQAGIYTCEALISSNVQRISGLSMATFDNIKAQASIQKRSAGRIPPLFEVKDHPEGRKIGLALLPPHSDNDVFFDIEGFPLDDGGLEYLWGCTFVDENGNRQFKDFWAHDRIQEKKAFQEFIAWVYGLWEKDRTMHIYHYANYEIAACRKLMSRYGVCEFEVDQLLRNEVFVDLYKVVKGALLVGEPRYSIKNVEHLYRGKRETEVGCGGDSVVVYEEWRENSRNGLDGDTWQTSKVLKDIRDYNIDDCNSTQELVLWLREQQQSNGIQFIGKVETEEPELPEEVTNRTKLRDKLLERASKEDRTKARISENLAWTLEFHRREAKPVFWRLFDRIGLEVEELVNDIDCLAGCIRTSREPFKPKPRSRNLAYEYKFNPEQEFKANAKNYYVVGEEDSKGNFLRAALLDEESDLSKGKLVVTSGSDLPQILTLIPDEYIRPDPIPQSIDAVVTDYEFGKFEGTAIGDFLHRNPPRIKGRIDSQKPVVNCENPSDRLKEIVSAVVNLDNSYLTIQGPPGSGKTYTGKHIIAELVSLGKRIGISSNSHKAINNLLIGVARHCRENNISAQCICSKNTGPEIEENGISVLKNADILGQLQDGCVVGTTAWGFCRTDWEKQFDYLFIDEAGQVAVANLVGMSRSAENLVLMGDQMQLGQPSQGIHPEDSGLSILDFLLHESPIIPDNMGVFLGTTYRMHSSVNDYISEAIYEGKLKSSPENDQQKIQVPEGYVGELDRSAGIIFIPVEHEGNTQASDEEAELIAKKANELLGRIYVDKHGAEKAIDWNDMLFVAPYNHQVNKLKLALGEFAKVGSVDKFQGQEAPVVFFSLCTSDPSESPRGIDFIFDKNRINVAISRAQALAIIVGNPDLFSTSVNSIEQMNKVNLLARLKGYCIGN